MWTGLTNPTPKAGVILHTAQYKADGMAVGDIHYRHWYFD